MTGTASRRDLRWPRRVAVVAVLAVTPCAVARPDLYRALALLAVATVLLTAVVALRRRGWTTLASGLLPAGERAAWRAEVAAVLHAAGTPREVRRQRRSFLRSLPACVLASWRATLSGRRVG